MQASRFGLIRVRSPLLTESRLISFPPGNEMFQFPGFASYGLYIHPQMTPSGCPVTPGFPIRTSPDQCSFDSSPGHFAAYHVLHRLSTPRHPPCTLSSLTTIMRGCLPTAASFRLLTSTNDRASRSSRSSDIRDSRSRRHRPCFRRRLRRDVGTCGLLMPTIPLTCRHLACPKPP